MNMVKRLFDLLVAGLNAPIRLSVIAIVAIVLLIADGWPPFFIQQRPGLGGKPFRIVMFRTMRGINPGAMLGIGAVATRDVEENCLVVDNPARVLRQLEPYG